MSQIEFDAELMHRPTMASDRDTPTVEGSELVGRFVFHDGRWRYAGPDAGALRAAAQRLVEARDSDAAEFALIDLRAALASDTGGSSTAGDEP